jgi:GrpB-like predicted nucleotidyltransferase (UPF0157 family)
MTARFWGKLARIGLPNDTVRLQPYTAVWAWAFRIEKLRLWAALYRLVVDIQHVGSTSVPGMPAKPIIDICMAIADYTKAMQCVCLIERLGYEYKGESDALRQHRFVKGQPTAYHLYLVEAGNEILEDGVCFRDYLIQHSDVARAYVDLKRQLARQFATDRRAYQQAKRAFVQQVIQMAKTEDQVW